MTAVQTDALATRELVRDAIDVLNEGNVVFGSGEVDYVAANLLEVIAEMHDVAGIELESLPQVREFARLVVEGWDL